MSKALQLSENKCIDEENVIHITTAFQDFYSGVKLAMMLGLSEPACQGILSDSW